MHSARCFKRMGVEGSRGVVLVEQRAYIIIYSGNLASLVLQITMRECEGVIETQKTKFIFAKMYFA